MLAALAPQGRHVASCTGCMTAVRSSDTPNMQLRHPSNPHASKVSRRVELMTTALRTVRRVTTKIPRERLVVMSACAHRKRNWGENERREEKLFHQCERVYRCRADRALLRRRWGAAIVAEMIALCHATTNALRHPSNPRASKVSRRVELMTTASPRKIPEIG